MTNEEYRSVGGPCVRKCEVDKKTFICSNCGLSYKLVQRDEQHEYDLVFFIIFNRLRFECR